jgi:uncharacterized protein YjbI with pentapeptide repeats
MEKITLTDTQKLLEVSMSLIDDARIEQSCLRRAYFDDVNMSDCRINNANLSDLEINGAQLGGAFIHNIGLPPEGHPFYVPGAKQRPLKFDDCYLGGSEITNCDLSGVAIKDCNLQGMTINGILVEELLQQYKK